MRKKKKQTIRDIVQDGMIVDLRSSHEEKRFDNVWLGSFKYLCGEVISLDGDDYSLDEEVERYEIDTEQNVLICWVKTEFTTADDFNARMNFYHEHPELTEDD